MKVMIKYGWIALLIAMLGDLLVPFILSPFYKEYSNTLMSISVLGNINSPVRVPFNVWMLIEGILFLVAIPAIYNRYNQVSKYLSIVITVFIAIFAIGACIFTCFFSVNESKDVITTAYKIHGVGSVTGFMLLLFVPLLLAILSFKAHERAEGIVSIITFVIGFLFFVLFVMSDKPEFTNTLIAKEGLWQRIFLLFMYIPLIVISINMVNQRLRHM